MTLHKGWICCLMNVSWASRSNDAALSEFQAAFLYSQQALERSARLGKLGPVGNRLLLAFGSVVRLGNILRS